MVTKKRTFAFRRWTISLFCLLLLHYFLAYHIISHLSDATRREEVSSFLFLLGVSDELAVQRIFSDWPAGDENYRASIRRPKKLPSLLRASAKNPHTVSKYM